VTKMIPRTRPPLSIAAVGVLILGAAAVADAEDTVPTAIQGDKAVLANWAFRVPQDESVPFHGVLSMDSAGTGSGAMLYPAPNAIAMLAAIATHAVIESSVRDSQKTKLQRDSDKVLLPYQDTLSALTERQLFEQAIGRARFEGGKSVVPASLTGNDEHVIDISPVFSLVQDQSAIVLDVVVEVHGPHATVDKSKPLYKSSFRLVSKPRDLSDPVSFWTANNGENLKNESAGLLGESMDLAIMDIARSTGAAESQSPQYKTFHYQEGRTDKVERGQLIGATDERTVLKTLRGWLMSVPTQHVVFADPLPSLAKAALAPAATVPAPPSGTIASPSPASVLAP